MEAFMKDVQLTKSHSEEKVRRLKEMELFVLDNSMRETTVGSLRAHTVENKRNIYNLIKKCGFIMLFN